MTRIQTASPLAIWAFFRPFKLALGHPILGGEILQVLAGLGSSPPGLEALMGEDGTPFKGTFAVKNEPTNGSCQFMVAGFRPGYSLKWPSILKTLELPACAGLPGFDGSSSTPVT